MNFKRQVLFWIGAFAVFVLFCWVLGDVLLPFVAGMVLAYLLNPLADRLEQHGLHRLVATLIVLGVFILIFIVAAIILLPLLGTQLLQFIQRVPDYFRLLQDLIVTEANQDWIRRMIGTETLDLRKSVGDLVGQGAAWAGTFLAGIWSGGRALLSRRRSSRSICCSTGTAWWARSTPGCRAITATRSARWHGKSTRYSRVSFAVRPSCR
jgi:predicted PurR-regulated permease PerM